MNAWQQAFIQPKLGLREMARLKELYDYDILGKQEVADVMSRGFPFQKLLF